MGINRDLRPLRNLGYAFALFATCAAIVLAAPAHQSPTLHTAFDGGIFVLTGVLALLILDMAWRANDGFAKLLAVAFAIAAAFELVHVAAAVEYSANPDEVAAIAARLRPSTWPPATYALPLGLIAAFVLRTRAGRTDLVLAAGLSAAGLALAVIFNFIPPYAPPGLFGMTRPSLVLVPMMWIIVLLLYWPLRVHERLARYIALFSILAIVSNVAMLYSAYPADDPALLAHAGKFANRMFLLFTLMQIGTLETARRIQGERDLTRLNDALEDRVHDSTVDLQAANLALRSEAETRANAEAKALAQLRRLRLLQQITHAIAERQDLRSIFQVVVSSLEDHLKVEFTLFCNYDAVDKQLSVAQVGPKSTFIAQQLGLCEGAKVEIGSNGLSECVRGRLVYEADLSLLDFQFSQRLAAAGLRSLVAVPLVVEQRSGVFGVLIVARNEPAGFGSDDCEFLAQLGENVALASNQTQLNVALQHAYDELRSTQHAIMQQERLRALGQMASGIAHDINNAISPATLYLDSILVRDTLLEPGTRRKLETIQRAIGDVAQTVARMGEFYRQRDAQLKPTPVNINVVLAQVPELTRARWSDVALAAGTSIKLKVEVAPDAPTIMAIESEIREALINLVFNAADALKTGGTIILRARRASANPHSGPQRVVVEVCDDGMGMDDEVRSRCLEPFFTTKGERGTGLGLAMVYGIAQRHRAELQIDSESGKGTTVRLIFPDDEVMEHVERERSVAADAPKLKILLIDDDPLILHSLRDALAYEGHNVACANSGQTGIDMFNGAHDRKEPFAAVITDLGMPHMDGRQVAAAIKAISGSTRVIMLTGWGQRLAENGETAGRADTILSKPPNMWDLRDALYDVVRASVQEPLKARTVPLDRVG